MWKPHYREFKELADVLSSEYKLRTGQGQNSHQVVKDLAKQNGTTVTSIYRYLKSTGTKLTGIEDLRAQKGKQK